MVIKAETGDRAELVVIGGGPGGYPAAFDAADRGMNVTLVNDEAIPGGVCLHRGCIPSKALLARRRSSFTRRDEADAVGPHLRQAEGRPRSSCARSKSSVVSKLTGGVAELCKAPRREADPSPGPLSRFEHAGTQKAGRLDPKTRLRQGDRRHRFVSGDAADLCDRRSAGDGLHRRPRPARRAGDDCSSSVAVTSGSKWDRFTPPWARK